MKEILISSLLSSTILHSIHATDYPQATISNEVLEAKLYLPDPDCGYYSATRYDWSGIIYDLEYKGHSYFGSWAPIPNEHSFVDKLGPVDVFSPIKHSSDATDSKFIKIGVGLLSLPSNLVYREKNAHTIVDHGEWIIKNEVNNIEFIHKLDADPYSYEYIKKIQLEEDRPNMVLAHTLKNTGTKTIKTSVYNHNFFVIDQQAVGNGFEITFSENISESNFVNSGFVDIRDNKMAIIHDFGDNDHINCRSISGYESGLNNFVCKIVNNNTGAGVAIKGDRAISKLAFWSYFKSICPEPYVSIEVKPGEEFSWNYDYHFFTQ